MSDQDQDTTIQSGGQSPEEITDFFALPDAIGVPMFISRNRRQELYDLAYPRFVVDTMTPAEADEIVKAQRVYLPQDPQEAWPAILAHLWRGGEWGYYWTLPAKLTTWRPTANPGQPPRGANVYFGVHPATERGMTGERAKIGDIAAVNCVFAEFDAKDYGDKPAILAHVDGLAVKPSALIDSGGGIHAYWFLRDPFIFAEQADRERARLLQAAWVKYVEGDNGAKDLARVLRVPGTQNAKYTPPRPVTVIRAELARRYTIGDLEMACKPTQQPIPPNNRHVSQANIDGDTGQFWLDKALSKAHPGNRNDTGFWLATQLRDAGLSQAEAEGWLLAYARLVPQQTGNHYGEPDALASLKSAFDGSKRESAKSTKARAAAPPAPVATPSAAPAAAVPALAVNPPLPQIIVTNRQMRAVTADAIDALGEANNPPALFVRSGALARVRRDEKGRPVIDDCSVSILRARMERAALWYRVTKDGDMIYVPPPEHIVKDAMALDGWPFPALDAITETPALRVDGSILDRPGYDVATGLYYVPAAGMAPPTVPSKPSRAELAAAMALIDETIGDFPYCDEASRANAFALLLTPVLRPAIVGNAPLALIDKPQAGTGASLLAEAVSILATGRQAAMMTAPRDDEEWRKKITAALLEGATVITIDNVETTLQSASLAAALTSSTWKDRLLGQSATVVVSQRATWLATGNNIRLGGDMPRRCYWIRLDAQTAHPWRRQNFRHPGLIGWVTENRGAILGALLTVARSWYAAGCPPAADLAPLGSFESWARTVGGVLTHAGIAGFLGNLDALYERVDEEGQAWLHFFTAWYDVIGEAEISTAELGARLRAGTVDPCIDPSDAALFEALPDFLTEVLTDPKRGASFSRMLGKALAKRTDMTFDDDGLRLEKRQDTNKKTQKWRLVRSKRRSK